METTEVIEMMDRVVEKYGLLEQVMALATAGLATEGKDHKQWHLAQILRTLGAMNEDLRKVTDNLGIAP